ncbi:hypothetical protein Ancab_027716 [Ancistrocladus abbreviatus]
MATLNRSLVVLATLAALLSVAFADSGIATYYTTYVPSACYGYADQGVMIAAGSAALYNNGAGCGKMYRVTCTGAANGGANPCNGQSVTVKLVDLCPGCPGPFDLSQQAFAAIANLDAGRIYVDYQQV